MMNFGVKILIATLGLAIPFAPVQAKADIKPISKGAITCKSGCESINLNKLYVHTGLSNQCTKDFLDKYLNDVLGIYGENNKPNYDCGNNGQNGCKNNCNELHGGKENCQNNSNIENDTNENQNSGQEKPDNDLDNSENQGDNNENNENNPSEDLNNVDINNGGDNLNGGSQENNGSQDANGSTENGQVESSFSEFQNRVIELVNQERAKAGVKPLKGNLELSNVATIKSQDMIDKNYFDHNSPTYGSPFDMMKKFGINFNMAGENIAYGQRTPEEVMKGWMNSPGHRQNILNPNFEQIGIGIAKNSNGVTYWTQMFIK